MIVDVNVDGVFDALMGGFVGINTGDIQLLPNLSTVKSPHVKKPPPSLPCLAPITITITCALKEPIFCQQEAPPSPSRHEANIFYPLLPPPVRPPASTPHDS